MNASWKRFKEINNLETKCTNNLKILEIKGNIDLIMKNKFMLIPNKDVFQI